MAANAVPDTFDAVALTTITASQVTGLGGAALLNVGQAAGTVAAGDDPRIAAAAADSTVVHLAGAEVILGAKTFATAPVLGALSGLLKGASGALTAAAAGADYLLPTGSGAGLVNLNPANLAAGTASISVTGNAGTVTNGVYTSGTYSNPSWLAALDGSKVTGRVAQGNLPAPGVTSGTYADGGALASHAASTANPHATTAAQVGLGNVSNTSDAAKPVSAAQQAALDGKAQVAASVAALRAASTTATHARTQGYYAAGDGGHSEYYWSATSTLADDGALVLRPAAVTANAPGRWLLLHNNSFRVKQFGARGDRTDDTAFFQAWANAVCACSGEGTVDSVGTHSAYTLTDTVQFQPPLATTRDVGQTSVVVRGLGYFATLSYLEQTNLNAATNVWNGQPKTWDNYRPLFLFRGVKKSVIDGLHVSVGPANRYVSGFDVVTSNGPELMADGTTPYTFGSAGTLVFRNCSVTGVSGATDWTGFRTLGTGTGANINDISYINFQDCVVGGSAAGTTQTLDGLKAVKAARLIGFQVAGGNTKEITFSGGTAATGMTVACTTFAPSTSPALYGGVQPSDGTELKALAFGGSVNVVCHLLYPGKYSIGPGRYEDSALFLAGSQSANGTGTAVNVQGAMVVGARPWFNGTGAETNNNVGLFTSRPKQATVADWSYNAGTGAGTLTLPSDTAATSGPDWVTVGSSNKFKAGDWIVVGANKGASTTGAAGNLAASTTVTLSAGHPYATGDAILINTVGPFVLGTTADNVTYNLVTTPATLWKRLGVDCPNAPTHAYRETRRVLSLGSASGLTGNKLVFTGETSHATEWSGAAVSSAAAWQVGDLCQVGVGSYPHASYVDFFVTAVAGNVLTLADGRAPSGWSDPAPATAAVTGSGQTAGSVQQPALRAFPFATAGWGSVGDHGPPSGCLAYCNGPGAWSFSSCLFYHAMPYDGTPAGGSANAFTLTANGGGPGLLALRGCTIDVGLDSWNNGGRQHFVNRLSGAWKYDAGDSLLVSNLGTAGLGNITTTAQNGQVLGYALGSTLALPGRQTDANDGASNLPMAAYPSGSGVLALTSATLDSGIGAALFGVLNVTVTSAVTLTDARAVVLPAVHGYTVVLTNATAGGQPIAVRFIDPYTNTPAVNAPTLANGSTRQFTFSNTAPISGGPGTVPNVLPCAPAPNVAGASGGAGVATLSWPAVPGGVAYTVRRSAAANGAYSAVSTAQAGTAFSDSGLASGATYFYKVTSINSYGDESYPSVAANVKAG